MKKKRFAGLFGRVFARRADAQRPRGGALPARSVAYSTSPLLASKTPPWRSKFIVGLVAASFIVLLGRALYIQVLGNAFFQRQGEIRFARNIDLPASRGRILDRNGQILAVSVPSPSIWAIPPSATRRRRSPSSSIRPSPAPTARRFTPRRCPS